MEHVKERILVWLGRSFRDYKDKPEVKAVVDSIINIINNEKVRD